MKPDEQALEKIYEKDQTGTFVISVAIEKYVDIFNELDSSPFRRRDLNSDLRKFLEECSSDIPLKNDIIVQFNVSQEKQEIEKEEKIRIGLKTYFSFVRNSHQKKI
jgi:type IV secretory pathway VirB9-like protein